MKRFALIVSLAFILIAVTVETALASPVISGIDPATVPNSGDVTITITGTGFTDQSTVWLESPYTEYRQIYGTVVSRTPTKIVATFPLDGATPAKYDVWVNCPFTSGGISISQDVSQLALGLSIYQGSASTATTRTTVVTTTRSVITTAAVVPLNGSVAVASSPSGANVYLDNVYEGLTPLTMRKVENGYHVIRVRLAGYGDWMSGVVVHGDSPSLYANLVPLTPSATVTAVPTSVATARRTVTPLGIEVGIIAIMGAVVLLVKRK